MPTSILLLQSYYVVVFTVVITVMYKINITNLIMFVYINSLPGICFIAVMY